MNTSGRFNIMLSAAGRRVALLRILRQALCDLDLDGEVVATDISLAAPAMHEGAASVLVPRCSDPSCLPFLLDLVSKRSIRLIVPTIDTELPFYAANREAFSAAGCRISVSSPGTIEIGNDKQRTHNFLKRSGISTVEQWSFEEATLQARLPLPLIAKPRFGSASMGVSIVRDYRHLHERAGESDLIVQTLAPGQEYTVDVFLDRSGRCLCAVPRLRVETRGGEMTKGVTVRVQPVIEIARRVAESLPGASGIMNIQIFHDHTTNQTNVIEINPRFGGGYPLSDHAGATMARWLLEETAGRAPGANDDRWREGVAMLRYDEAFFTNHHSAGIRIPGSREG